MTLNQLTVFAVIGVLLAAPFSPAQIPDSPDESVAGIPVNYTESEVGDYTLPDPLLLPDGQPVTDAQTWYEKMRPRILTLFQENQYGRCPARPEAMTFDVFEKGTPAFDGAAVRKQVTIYLTEDKTDHYIDLLVYLPADAEGPVPLLLNLGFFPNNVLVHDPNVKTGRVWNRRENKYTPAVAFSPWAGLDVRLFTDAGFGIATFNYTDVDPDALGAVAHGVRGLYLAPGQTEPAPDEWGAISAWAWGMSRAMDYFETDIAIDEKRVAITGISRLGKTVLWAGARDPRFAMVIASCSGEGGAALSRRNYGETIAHLTEPTRFPYQFCANYARYADNVDAFPVDAHMLLALTAPRPVLLQTGYTDKWSDPYGEFLAAVAAGPVFELLGAKGLGTDEFPSPGQPLLNTLGFYMHAGGHGAVPEDWDIYLQFMQKHLR